MYRNRKQQYYCTGKYTTRCEILTEGYFIEHNSAIGMYRVNHLDCVPYFIMGYENNKDSLRSKVNKYIKTYPHHRRARLVRKADDSEGESSTFADIIHKLLEDEI